jgi:transcriptional regulator with XRE-family HTH domain
MAILNREKRKMFMKIKEAIRQSGYSQSEIANLMGISRQQLNRWTTGKYRPRAARLRQLAKILKIDVKTLID